MRSITDIQLEIRGITNKLNSLYTELEDLKPKDVNTSQIDFEKMKSLAKAYPIKGHPLQQQDEYNQKLYLTLLASVAQMDINNNEEKLKFIQRIICGGNLNINIADISKAAFQINDKLLEEFSATLSRNGLAINFAVDIMIIANLSGKCTDEVLEYISALFEVIKLEKQGIQFVIKMSKAVLMQDAEIYEDILSDSFKVKLLNFRMYTSNISKERYENYIIENSSNKIVLKSKEKVVFDCNLQGLLDGKNDVRLENLIINLRSATNLEFKENHKMVFKNCEFIGDGGSKYLILDLRDCKIVSIENCIFQNLKQYENIFETPIITIINTTTVSVMNNKFVKCIGNNKNSVTKSPIVQIWKGSLNLGFAWGGNKVEVAGRVYNVVNNEFIGCIGDQIKEY